MNITCNGVKTWRTNIFLLKNFYWSAHKNLHQRPIQRTQPRILISVLWILGSSQQHTSSLSYIIKTAREEIFRVTNKLQCRWQCFILSFNTPMHTHTHTLACTHTHTQDKEPIECSAVTALHNKGKLGLTERESTQPGPKSSWNWTFDSCLRGCLCEIVTSIPSNKNSRLHPCIQPVQKVSPNRSTSDRWARTKGGWCMGVYSHWTAQALR